MTKPVCTKAAVSYSRLKLHCEADLLCDLATSLVRWGDTACLTTLQGWTPLHHAAFRGDLEVVSSLIACGADIAAEDFQAGPQVCYTCISPTHCGIWIHTTMLISRLPDFMFASKSVMHGTLIQSTGCRVPLLCTLPLRLATYR